MPTHKTKTSYIDALYFDGNSEELAAFVGEEFVKDASFLFPGEEWTSGYKVVRMTGTWLTLGVGQWLVKIDGVPTCILSNDDFLSRYESV